MGSKFPDQGWNLDSLHWEHGVLATGPAGKSQESMSFFNLVLAIIWFTSVSRGAKGGLRAFGRGSFGLSCLVILIAQDFT